LSAFIFPGEGEAISQLRRRPRFGYEADPLALLRGVAKEEAVAASPARVVVTGHLSPEFFLFEAFLEREREDDIVALGEGSGRPAIAPGLTTVLASVSTTGPNFGGGRGGDSRTEENTERFEA
jgi:hypothetical protein